MKSITSLSREQQTVRGDASVLYFGRLQHARNRNDHRKLFVDIRRSFALWFVSLEGGMRALLRQARNPPSRGADFRLNSTSRNRGLGSLGSPEIKNGEVLVHRRPLPSRGIAGWPTCTKYISGCLGRHRSV